jgi:hypothetical protein
MQAFAAQYTPQRLRPSLQQHVTYYLEIYQLHKSVSDECNGKFVMNTAVERMGKKESYKTYSKELCLKECRKVMHDEDSNQFLSKYYHITA